MSENQNDLEMLAKHVSNPEDLMRRIGEVGQPKHEESPPEEDPSKEADPKKQKVYRFFIEHQIGRQKVSGWFKNRILSVTAHIALGVYRSQLTGGVPWASLDPVTRSMSEAIAHLMTSLIERPQWAENIPEIEDPALIRKIYAEVDAHEATFRGSQGDDSEGEG
jgi:hypothetical protein